MRSKRAFAQTSEVKDADGGAEFAEAANKFVVQEVDGLGLDGAARRDLSTEISGKNPSDLG